MRYSKLFGKTSKTDFSQASTRSHQLLLRAGFIRESVAGRYYFLPLGWRVHEKIKKIVKEEMDAAGAQEMITPTLHPLELWQETNRNAAGGFGLMGVEDRRGAQFALGGTAEEMLVDLMRRCKPVSYKDLPVNLYQFSTKFRDEMRARGGLLRVREFVMKDGYSFHTDETDFVKEYENMAGVYDRAFRRCGLTPIKVLADNGYIGGDYCHEYQVETAIGEGTFFAPDDGGEAVHEDVATFDRGQMNPDEDVLPMETVELPTAVKTMADCEKHYAMPAWRFLKNVVYKNSATGELIIVVIRGDLDVNKTKLEKHLRAAECLEDASEEDLQNLGTKSGFVHSWGHDARYIGDLSLTSVKNFYGGFKTETTDPINVNFGRDFDCELADLALAYDGAKTETGATLRERRGVEVGNIFQLGTHYTNLMKGAVFVDDDGKEKPFYMGCYGIGIGRTMQTIAEIHADDRGLVWPDTVAPYTVHLVTLGKPGEEAREKAEEIYAALIAAGIEVLFDDREKAAAGEKFADADLIGCPTRVTVSKKSLEAGGVEILDRKTGDSKIISIENIQKDLSK